MTLSTLIVRYSAFAAVAILVNLAVQRIVLHWGESATLFMLAVAAGTGAGLVVKFLLDKHWIFYDRTQTIADNSRKFSLYTATGIITTAIFWGTETAFWLIWNTQFMREFGAILGLSVGYIVKYNLDARFVFSRVQAEPNT